MIIIITIAINSAFKIVKPIIVLPQNNMLKNSDKFSTVTLNTNRYRE